ncbi:DUF2007 domain-containing protein [Chryseobacterium sp. A301]
MERKTRVSVFESAIQQEIQLVKSKLDEAGIENAVENAYMTFTTTPTANMLSVKVNLNKEQEAFDIIDQWLLESKATQN